LAKLATMGLYVSYAIPILLGANARRAGRWKRLGPFHLRGYGVLVAWCAVAWCALVLVVCSLPPNFLAAAMLAGVLLVLVATYVIAVRSRFKGPKVDLAMLER
jgi:amino acid transporter